MRYRMIVVGFLLAFISHPALAQRSGTARTTRPAAPPSSNFRIGEIRFVEYNVGHDLADADEKPIPPLQSPLEGFLDISAPSGEFNVFNVPLVMLVEVLYTERSNSNDTAWDQLIVSATQTDGRDRRNVSRLPAQAPVDIRMFMATKRPTAETADRAPKERTWLPFIYYVNIICKQFVFTATIRKGPTGPIVGQKSEEVFIPKFCGD